MKGYARRYALIFPLLLLGGSVAAQSNARFTFSIRGFRHYRPLIDPQGHGPHGARTDGHCGKTIVAPPGSLYDDGTFGFPYYTEWREFPDGVTRYIARQRRGFTWEVVLTSEDNPIRHGVVYGWHFVLGVEGPLWIHDVTADGTVSCGYCEHISPGSNKCRTMEECRGPLFEFTDLIDPTEGEQVDPNVALRSTVALTDGWVLPPEGSWPLLKIRMFGQFPEEEGQVATGRVYFTTWVAPSTGRAGGSFVEASGQGQAHADRGDPPLQLEACEYTLKASSFASFIRCDPNEDGELNVADAVWIFMELFSGAVETRCPPAADCNGDWKRDISDGIYGLSFLFLGGPEPPEPFPDCRIEGPVEDCPPGAGSIACR